MTKYPEFILRPKICSCVTPAARSKLSELSYWKYIKKPWWQISIAIKETTSLVKYATHFLQKLCKGKNILEESLLVTKDLKAFYINTQNNKRINLYKVLREIQKMMSTKINSSFF